jgi:hypothetical protein
VEGERVKSPNERDLLLGMTLKNEAVDHPICCGQPMNATSFPLTGVKVWQCSHRWGHPTVLEDMKTGQRETEGVKVDD